MIRLTTARWLSARDDVPHEEDTRTRHMHCMSSLSISCDESLYQPIDVGQDALGRLNLTGNLNRAPQREVRELTMQPLTTPNVFP